LVAIYGNFVNRALVLTQKFFEGTVPEITNLNDYDRETLSEIAVIRASVEKSLEEYRFREALKEAMSLARLGNKYLADTEPWKLIKTDETRVKTILNVSLQLAANMALLSEPFLPFSSARLKEMLRLPQTSWESIGNGDLLEAGHKLNEPSLLFEKIEDEAIEKQLKRLEDTKKANEKSVYQAAPSKPDISYDEFATMDIRVGTILEASRVPKTDQLMQLLIDVGIDKRTIISGIAEHFTPEELPGKQVSVLVNLAPRKLKGITSQGMILLAENADGKLVFVTPENAVTNGVVVK
jgi:methionyl-tRNA synthetase